MVPVCFPSVQSIPVFPVGDIRNALDDAAEVALFESEYAAWETEIAARRDEFLDLATGESDFDITGSAPKFASEADELSWIEGELARLEERRDQIEAGRRYRRATKILDSAANQYAA